MSQPQGLMFKEVAQTDPAGLGDTVSLRLRALQAGTEDARIVAGRITSADGRHVLISATPAFRSSEVKKSAALMDAVLKAARSVESRFPNGSVQIAITGAHRSALDNATMIRQDTTRTSVIATIAVAVLMLAAYRRRWLALLGLLPPLFGALGAVVIFYLTGDPVSAVALGCGSILIGVTVDYGVYVLYHTDDSPPADREQLARAVAQLVPALTFGALTTMAAFLVMFVSPVSGHRQLGLFGAVGVALAALFAMLVLPLFIPAGAAGKVRRLPLTLVMQCLFDWRARRARLMLVLLLLFTGACFASVWRLRFDGDLARLNGVTVETRRDEEAIRAVWGKALSLTTVVVSGANREEALQKNERICAALRELQENRTIESFSSIAPLMPSEQARRANLRDWQAFLDGTPAPRSQQLAGRRGGEPRISRRRVSTVSGQSRFAGKFAGGGGGNEFSAGPTGGGLLERKGWKVFHRHIGQGERSRGLSAVARGNPKAGSRCAAPEQNRPDGRDHPCCAARPAGLCRIGRGVECCAALSAAGPDGIGLDHAAANGGGHVLDARSARLCWGCRLTCPTSSL